MSSDRRKKQMHTLDVTLWVGKNGIEPAVDELRNQFEDRRFVKVKFHRSSRAGSDTAELAEELADRVHGSVVDTRGHTAVIER